MTTYDLEAALENSRKYWAHLIDAEKEAQTEAMQEWFYANYEGPAERAPQPKPNLLPSRCFLDFST